MSLSSPITTSTRTAAQEANRIHGASALARYTSARRQQLGFTVAQAAELSGLQISEWCGIEEGWVPEDVSTLRSIAGVLQVRWTDYHMLAFWAECHQKCC